MGRPREMTGAERAALVAQGYSPVEMWVPDLLDPDVRRRAVEEANRIAAADSEEDVMTWIEAVQKDMWEGEDQL